MAFIYFVVNLVLLFNFLNGFHDSAKSIATVVSTIVLSPLVAVMLAAFFNFIAFTIFPLKKILFLPSSIPSLGHGVNDDQKSMGLGTLFGGWKIVKTMGQKITREKPFEGFCAEMSGVLTLFGATHSDILVSTTHTMTVASTGVGVSSVKWGVTKKNFWASILTIPVSVCIGSIMYFFFNLIF